ncbi:MAG: hypothetical protein AB1646_19695 [Thermodesulfobacteriota bacterium]
MHTAYSMRIAAMALAVGLAILPSAADQAWGDPPSQLSGQSPVRSAALFSGLTPGSIAGPQRSGLRPQSSTLAPDSPFTDRAIGLSPEEYSQFREIARLSRATAWEVGLLNVAVKGSGLLMGSIVWLVFLLILRRLFDYWWTERVWGDKYTATIVICVKLLATAWVLGMMVS